MNFVVYYFIVVFIQNGSCTRHLRLSLPCMCWETMFLFLCFIHSAEII